MTEQNGKPLEDLLDEGRYAIGDVDFYDGVWHAEVSWPDEHGSHYHGTNAEGIGATIEDAVRNALAIAKERR